MTMTVYGITRRESSFHATELISDLYSNIEEAKKEFEDKKYEQGKEYEIDVFTLHL